jgi:hypothetical protein
LYSLVREALNNPAVALDQRAICVQPAGHPANHGAKALELLLLEPDDGSWNQNLTSFNCSVVSYTGG